MDEQTVRSRISVREVVIGNGVVIEEGATITGPHGPAERVVLGDSVYIGEHCKFRVPILEIGDYTQIQNHTLATGYKALTIGYNGWFGQNTILNSTDQLGIRNNCGIRAYSQLWTHIAYGDVLQGCRWNSTKPMFIGNDVWLVGHCVVSPIIAADRSMALIGSVVTPDMQDNHVYADSPAKDVTDKVGPQFEAVSMDRRVAAFAERRLEFPDRNRDVAADLIGVAADGTW